MEMNSPKKVILIVQPLEFQGQLWQTALESQGVNVVLDDSTPDPSEALAGLEQAGSRLPSLALIEIGELKNPYEFCRSCRANYPDMAIILTNSKQREISAPEQRWAIFQGVQDLLSGFHEDVSIEDITTKVERVLDVLGWRSLRQDVLAQRLATVPTLQRLFKTEQPDQANDAWSNLMDPLELPDRSTPDSAFQPISSDVTPANRPSTTKPKKSKKPPEDPSDGMMYRGVRLK